MNFRRLALPSALLALACLAPPAPADPPYRAPALRSDILYTHRGEFVRVGPMRALTLNAHVEQFQYHPLGVEAAVVGSEPQGDGTLHFVKTLDMRTGRELSRLSFAAPADDHGASFALLGWSVSGKLLLLEKLLFDPQNPDTAQEEYLRWDLSADPPAARVISPEAALPSGAQPVEGSAICFLSPDHRWIVFTQKYQEQGGDGKPGPDQTAYLLYDPERDTFRSLTLPPGASTFGWSDAGHLRLWPKRLSSQLDVVTGQISPVTSPTSADAPAASKLYPDLTLDVEARTLEDGAVLGSGGHVEAEIVWVRRTPPGKLPLGAAPAGLMPRSYDPSDQADPLPAWSPTGRQVAFIANRELCVSDLSAATDSMPNEKMGVGLKLSCAEELALAISDLKQIGLGIVQYTQDNDENLPAADGFTKTVYPYLKTMDVFQVGSHRFVYEQPADLALVKMEAPADTEEGYMDLPCARVVLFADGHVKAFPKAGAAP